MLMWRYKSLLKNIKHVRGQRDRENLTKGEGTYYTVTRKKSQNVQYEQKSTKKNEICDFVTIKLTQQGPGFKTKPKVIGLHKG